MNPTFVIEMEDGRTMKGELYPDMAPNSVANFVELANSGFYDGVIFHRVIPGFMTVSYKHLFSAHAADSLPGQRSLPLRENDA